MPVIRNKILMQTFKQKVVSGVVWSFLETLTAKFGAFIVTLVLSRILTPDDYGVVALIVLIVNMTSVILDSGFGQALVQKKDANDQDYNSVYYFGLVLSFVLYLVLFFVAPLVADFYKKPELKAMLRVLSLTLLIGSAGGVQGVWMQKHLRFNLSFKMSLCRFFTASIVGVSLALFGCGPWALVYSTVSGSLASSISGWIYVRWRPRLIFSLSALKGLYSFGWKFSVSWLISVVYDNVYGMIIGKVYTPSDLAFYDKGRQVPQLGLLAIGGTIQKVSFPAIAELQDDKVQVRNAMRKMIQCTTFMVTPLMTGIAVCSGTLIPLLFGKQWDNAIPYAVIASGAFILYPFHMINLQTLSALGRSDIFLKLEIIKKIISLIMLLMTYKLGVLWMVCICTLVEGPIGFFVNAYPNGKILGYSMMMQIRDALPSIATSAAMALGVYMLRWLPIGAFAILVLQIFFGLVMFFTISWVARLDALKEYLIVVDGALPRISPCLGTVFHAAFTRRFKF